MAKIDIYHNIRWSRYKARVFSALHRQAKDQAIEMRFFQIADTSSNRTNLSDVELNYHQYPHELLFPGSYENIPKWKLVLTLFNKVFHSNADLILIHGYSHLEHWAMLLAAILSGKKRGMFCDSTLYDRSQSRWKALFKISFFRLCNAHFAYGTRSRDLLVHYGTRSERIFHPCQAAALPDNYNTQAVKAARLAFAPLPNTPRLLYVGRLSPEKSLGLLIRAIVKLRNSIPELKLALIGDGSQRKELETLSHSLGLNDVIEFTGSLSQEALAAEYLRASCLVLPSYSEPWGLVVNEALHYGCPVVVSNHCGCVPELVHDGVTGFVFRSGDVNDLVRNLQKILIEFTNLEQVTDRCLAAIAPYSPDTAAAQILRGSTFILAGRSA